MGNPISSFLAALRYRLDKSVRRTGRKSRRCAGRNEAALPSNGQAEATGISKTPSIGNLDLESRFVWGDEFDGDGPVDPEKWRHEPMTDGMHQVGNFFDGVPVKGLRHNGVYGERNDSVAFRRNNKLMMRLELEEAPNPYRKNVIGPDGFNHRLADFRVHTPWIDTAGIVDFGPNHIFEVRVNLENMVAGGARLSGWAMPQRDRHGNDAKSDAYDDDASNGMEADWFEYDPADPNRLQCKLIGDKAGQTREGSVDLGEFGIDLTAGYHTITVVRTTTYTAWIVDGIEILRDAIHVPLSFDSIILSMEVNTGAKPDPQPYELKSDPPYVPDDPGLYAKNIAKNFDKIEQHHALIDYVRVFEIV